MVDVPQIVMRRPAKSAVALGLTFAAGIVDIVGYLAIYHLFVAHMTGGTVRVGQSLAEHDWPEAAKALSVIFSFVAGSILGRVVIQAGARRRIRRVPSITLIAEAILIVTLIWVAPYVIGPTRKTAASAGTICALLALLAAAMGLQTATLTHIGPLTIHTTFVTGMLNKFAESVSKWAFWIHDEWSSHDIAGAIELLRRSATQGDFRAAIFMASIWACYLLGSLAGTWMNSRWNVQSLWLPVLLLVLAAVVDRFRPLSVEEEKEQI